MSGRQSNSSSWLMFVGLGLFVVLTFGLDTDTSIDFFGRSVSPWIPIVGLYLTGALAGWASRSRR